jgi:transcriptional regulator with XRE-family HTH domain
MSPFGETVLAWRIARGMTQAELARDARVSRPNLSAIERGDREVTLKTLRALAAGLDVRAGLLVDGVLPSAPGDSPALDRASLERIAGAAAQGRGLADRREEALSSRLRTVLSPRMEMSGQRLQRRHGRRAADQAYLLLKASETPETVVSLINRTAEKLD